MPGLRRIALAVLATLVAIGCSSTSPSAGELRVGLGADQYVVEGPSANLGMGLNITETLTTLTPDFGLAPGLAERWELVDGSRWRFHLRENVTFHDGQPFDARAVKERLFDRVAAFGDTALYAGPDSVAVVDDHTIDFTPTQPDPRVAAQLSHPIYGVYAPGSDLGAKPIGTGPFRFASYTPAQRLVVERNDDYWGERSRAKQITFRFLDDPEVRRRALEAGEIDIATSLRPTDVAGLDDKNIKVETSPVGAYEAMYANIHKPGGLLGDATVRQALASSIDRQTIVSQLLEGKGTVDVTLVPPTMLGDDASLVTGHPFDIRRANQLLDDDGWVAGGEGIREKDGRRLQLDLAVSSPEAFGTLPAFLQSQLKAVGVDVKILEMPDEASYEAAVTAGGADLYLEQGFQNDADPAFLPSILFYGAPSADEVNYPALFAPGQTFDGLLAPSLTEEPGPAVRRSVAEAMHDIVDTEAVVLPLAGIPDIHGVARTVTGFVPHGSLLSTRWATVASGGK